MWDAAGQLSVVGDCPGIVALDLARDSELGNVASGLQDVLAREPWAEQLSGVLLVKHGFIGTPDCRVYFIRGRDDDRVRAAAACLTRMTYKCPHGRLHSTTGVFPAQNASRESPAHSFAD